MTGGDVARAVYEALRAARRAGLVQVHPGAVALVTERIVAALAADRATVPAPRRPVPDLTPPGLAGLDSLTLPAADPDEVPTKRQTRPRLAKP